MIFCEKHIIIESIHMITVKKQALLICILVNVQTLNLSSRIKHRRNV